MTDSLHENVAGDTLGLLPETVSWRRRIKLCLELPLAYVLAHIFFLFLCVTDYVYVAELIGLVPFRFGDRVRYLFYQRTLAQCGRDVTINFGSIISDQRSTIGEHVWVGTYCIFGHVNLRDYTIIAQGCHVVDGPCGHGFDRTDVPIMRQPGQPRQVDIGPDVWLGAHVTVMADVGRGCVVGAGSVVTKSVPDWSVAVGNPARVIRSRIESDSGT